MCILAALSTKITINMIPMDTLTAFAMVSVLFWRSMNVRLACHSWSSHNAFITPLPYKDKRTPNCGLWSGLEFSIRYKAMITSSWLESTS